MSERQIDTILSILNAYPRDLVKTALKRRNAYLRGERTANGWQIYAGEGEPPDEMGDRMRVGSLWYIRARAETPGPTMAASAPSVTGEMARVASSAKKADLSPKRTDKRCPSCGEEMIFEPICAGCALGKMGFRGRFVCMDDMSHEFYVTRAGVELPNQ